MKKLPVFKFDPIEILILLELNLLSEKELKGASILASSIHYLKTNNTFREKQDK